MPSTNDLTGVHYGATLITQAFAGTDLVWAATPYATGGAVTEVGGFRIHTFNSTGALDFSRPGEVEYLVIAGGGSGLDGPQNSGLSGGGGAGGYLTGSIEVARGVHTITVGAGGFGNSVNGQSSSIVKDGSTLVTTVGGGGGGKVGGSGGGDAAGTAGQGNNGGSKGAVSGAGGGGAGAVGGNGSSATVGGNGGAGLASSITGTSVTRAAGGGGGTGQGGGTPGTGGAGGGGNGGTTDGSPSTTAGAPNTGSGGGGGQPGDPVNFTKNQGGSGVVIVRYPL